jgi:hypothetical protein
MGTFQPPAIKEARSVSVFHCFQIPSNLSPAPLVLGVGDSVELFPQVFSVQASRKVLPHPKVMAFRGRRACCQLLGYRASFCWFDTIACGCDIMYSTFVGSAKPTPCQHPGKDDLSRSNDRRDHLLLFPCFDLAPYPST